MKLAFNKINDEMVQTFKDLIFIR
nr:hypothetical protein [Tanacetum cinerariifolium]